MSLSWLSTKSLFGLTIGLGIGYAGFNFLFHKKPKAHTHETYVSKTLLLAILKEINREMIALAISLATTAAQIREQMSPNYPEKIILQMIESSTSFPKQMESLEKRVYERFNTNKKVVEKAFKKDFHDDPDIQDLCLKARKIVENAFKGILPVIGSPLPDFMTSDFVLSIMREIYNKNTKATLIMIREAETKGILINFKDQRFIEVTQEIETKIELEKREIFEKYRLMHYEDSPSCIIHNAIKQFSQNSKEFRRELNRIENGYHSTIQQIMQNQLSRDQEFQIMNRLD
ncbi:unnamed protein product [Blepharisma stoltei]|uniref:Uncharacterized protein n=1 Tax=Blepharisma stoltei TaxID=1481888 RepID=A0AAU9JW54_9CILI|nr:unnamed protein product [Blepharisma stoltei]